MIAKKCGAMDMYCECVCVCVCRLWVCLLLFSALCLRFSLKQAFLYYHVVLTFGEWIGIESEKSSCNRYLVFFSRVYLLIPLKERKIELYWRFPIMNALKNGSDIHVHKYENIYSHVFCLPKERWREILHIPFTFRLCCRLPPPYTHSTCACIQYF